MVVDGRRLAAQLAPFATSGAFRNTLTGRQAYSCQGWSILSRAMTTPSVMDNTRSMRPFLSPILGPRCPAHMGRKSTI